MEYIPVRGQLAADQNTDHFDPWQVVFNQVFIHCSRLLISTAFVVVSRIVCIGVAGEYV